MPLTGPVSTSRVLLVSDDASVSDMCSRTLQLDGFDVRVAFTFREALFLTERHRPNTVVVDLRLPLGAALNLIEQIRRVPGMAHAPVALVTGDYFATPQGLDRLRALGVTERFRPVWLSELVGLTRELMHAAVLV